ncbi:hypothetical protein GGS26DRAFT_596816 [Hypomontagnella submonticulosa]|nr:hypothetical protein GGS26DRAFT_596816 [Hypomontagnella submonticulosa]
MSSTSVSSAPSAVPSSCGSMTYVIPVQDAACAVPSKGNYTDVMGACCGAADVVSYYDNCGLYCLAAGQTVADLTKCLHEHGASDADVFCNMNTTATATATDAPLPTSATVVVTHSGGSSPTQSGSGDSSASPTKSPSGAAGLRPEFGSLSTVGLTIGALLFSATAFGAFQL